MKHISPEDSSRNKYWLALKYMPYMRGRIYSLVDQFGSPENLYFIDRKDLDELGFTQDKIREIESFRNDYDLDHEFGKLYRDGIALLTDEDDIFPESLKNAPGYPRAIFIKGTISKQEPTVAIVGARNATHQGLAMAHELAADLVSAGVVVISGGARGIDTAAHKGALESGGTTYAILGCGIDISYPRENRTLFSRVIESGALISEFAPGTKPLSHHFPMRNRIIAGMSNVVIVVEAAAKSGALITADFALEYGRDVCAVPGFSKNKLSKGSNTLIKNGAQLIESAQDVLDMLDMDFFIAKKEIDLPEPERILIEALGWDIKTIDELIHDTRMQFQQISKSLLMLELSGLVHKDISGRYLRIR